MKECCINIRKYGVEDYILMGQMVLTYSPVKIAGYKTDIIKILFVCKYNNWTEMYQCKYF